MFIWRQCGKILFSVLWLATVPALAQNLNPVNWSGKLDPAEVKAGGKAKLTITAKIDAGWHLYSLTQPPGGPRATKITLDENSLFQLDGKIQQPKPKVAEDPNFSTPGQPFMTETFEKEVSFTVPLKLAADAPAGAQKLIAKVNFQVCDEHQCLPPRTRPIEIETNIIAANLQAVPTPTQVAAASPSPTKQPSPTPSPSATSTATATPAAATGATTNTTPPSNAPADLDYSGRLKARGLLGYLWFAFISGLIALLTPCVFPMIPITVSFFTKREQRTTGEALKQALIYCFGIIGTFVGLGLLLTLIAGPTGINKLATNPWMNLFLTTLFVVFALNLFGMFEIRVPSSLLSKLDAQSQGGTTLATLLMGLTFTLTSFTCTAAFVGTVLVTATQGDWFWPTMGMLAFATAFALPFFLLALFPRWLQSLPKSGGWMNSVKVVMGFLELAAAFKFLSNVDLVWGWQTVSRNMVLAAWIAIAIVTTLYLLGKFQLPHDSPVKSLSVPRMLSAVLFLSLAFYFLTGLFGANLGEWEAMLPPHTNNGASGFAANTTTGQAQYKWLEKYDEALQRAQAENKPVFLNFTGVTCTNCRWMESNMFTDANVKKELERFVLAELYTDRETPEHQAEDEKNGQLQADKFGTVALPLYAIVAPNGDKLATFPGLTRDKKEFIGFLQAGAQRFGQQVAQRQ